MFLDVDNFKSVNDELGHSNGDNLIIYVADVLKGSSRQSDTCARYGEDEFLILLERCQTDDAQIIVDKIQKKLSTGLHNVIGSWSGKEHISLSIRIQVILNNQNIE